MSLVLCLMLLFQGAREQRLEDFREERDELLVECGKRHLDYALELRDRGLTVQSAAQLVLAVEVSEGRHEGATLVLHYMRTCDDAFWKRKRTHVAESKLEAYRKKAARLRAEDDKARLALVKRAQALGLAEVAFDEVKALLAALDDALVFADDGALVLPGGKLEGELARRFRGAAIEVNGRLVLRDPFLARLPELARVSEATTPTVRVRTDGSEATARELLLAASALCEHLGQDLGAVPDRRLQLFVFETRALYERYLTASGQGAYRAADGFADGVTGTAVVCREGSDSAHVLGLALHELTHLYQLCVSRAALPSWYFEGSAECFGGEGAFAWDGTKLAVRQPLAEARLADVRAAPFPLRELLTTDALTLFTPERARQRIFYAQSWALVRFLESAAAGEFGERYATWRARCFGAAVGANFEHPYERDASTSRDLFLAQFERDLPALEQAFRSWLAEPDYAPAER